jgi:hypothetical protein
MSSDRPPPPALKAVQAQLSSGHGIEICVLPADAHLAVSQSAAVAIALERFGQSSSADVGAFAVAATATNYGDVQADGTLKLRISDRPVWLVLIPNMEIPQSGPRGRPYPPFYTATLAVLVDANTGDYLMAATV